MTNDATPIVQTWHADNLLEFSRTGNGNRNNELNKQAMASFQLALGDSSKLSVDTVRSDYEAAAIALGLDRPAIRATLESALAGAKSKPRDLSFSSNGTTPQVSKPVDLMLAPTYTALEDYAKAHGVPVSAFELFKWSEQESGKRGKCLLVPCEDGITRVRYLDGKNPKWMPIKPEGMTEKITPCWYGFKRGISLACKAPHKTVVICNGQPSVVAAQHHSVPAIAQTDGEGKLIITPLLKRLKTAISENGLKVIVAYDGDASGRDSTKKVQEQLQVNKIPVSVVHFGGDDHYDLADHCKRWGSKSMEQLQRLARFSDVEITPVVSGKQLADEFEQSIKFPTAYLPPGEMIITPMEQFHSLGGLATMLLPGMLTEVMGPSGGGKTSFLETWQDWLRKIGFDSLWYSPEWIPKAMHYRTLQRYGGAYGDDIWANVLWYKEQAEGIKEHNRKGKQMKPNSKAGQCALKVNEDIKKWPGDIHCFQSNAVTEIVLEDMTKKLQLLRRDGRRVGVAFFDYAQLLHTVTEEKGRNSYEIIVSSIKRWCQNNHIHGIVGSQVTKAVARQCIEQKRLLGKYDSHWVAPNEFNLIITLNIVYDGVDKITQEPIKTNKALINVCKNSTGQEGVLRMKTDFKHLAWVDERWND